MEHKDERGVEAREIRQAELAEVQEALAGAPAPAMTDADLDAWYTEKVRQEIEAGVPLGRLSSPWH